MSSNSLHRCANCGTELRPGAHFCPHCDAPVTPTFAVPPSNPPVSSSGRLNWIVGGAALGVIVVVIVLGVLYFSQFNSNPALSPVAEVVTSTVSPTVASTLTETPTPLEPTPVQESLVAEIPTFTPSPTLTPTPVPSPTFTSVPPTVACINNAVYVADVTIPDGTVINAGQSFVKTWRLRNAGNCAWDSSYSFTFTGGEQMSGASPQAVTGTEPNGTVDIAVAMIAPTAPGTHTGLWQMNGPNGAFFGTAVTVVISVPYPATAVPPPSATNSPATPTITTTPAACSGAPHINYFTASPTTINAGHSTTLNWGKVNNASSVSIDQGINGIATPGSLIVSPVGTTTFTLTAICAATNSTATAQVTVTVNPATIYSQGNLSIPQSYVADLDAGTVGAGGADFWFEAETANKRYVTPKNGALIAKVGTTAPGIGGCMSASLAGNRLNINNLPQGMYVCVRTNQGRYSQFRVTAAVGPSPGTLKIAFTTWN